MTFSQLFVDRIRLRREWRANVTVCLVFVSLTLVALGGLVLWPRSPEQRPIGLALEAFCVGFVLFFNARAEQNFRELADNLVLLRAASDELTKTPATADE